MKLVRSILKNREARKLETPIKTDGGENWSSYRLPPRPVRCRDGVIRQQITLDDAWKVLIADKLGTDDPKTVDAAFQEFKFQAKVRAICRDELQKARRRAQEVRENERWLAEITRHIEQQCAHPVAQEQTRDYPDNIVNTAFLRFKGNNPEAMEKISTGVQMIPTNASRAHVEEGSDDDESRPDLFATVDELLQAIANPEERELVRAHFEKHPSLRELAASGRGTVRVTIRDGIVRTGYRETIPAHRRMTS